MHPLKVFLFAWILIIASGVKSYAQAPPNDDCGNSIGIATGNGFGYGKFTSQKVNLRNATRQSGETVDSLLINVGNDKKTVWYRFETKTRRSVSVQLRQKDSGIAQNAVGFSVYRTNSCVPNHGLISNYLPSISKFGASASTCLPAGVYLIQVCANKSAADSIWIELNLGTPSPNDYDKRRDAFEFFTIGNTTPTNVTFHAGCQSIDSSGEVCSVLGQDYSESAWLTFKTPSYLDQLSVNIYLGNIHTSKDTIKIGYNLYEGNARDTSIKLALIDGCNTLQTVCTHYGNTVYCPGNMPLKNYNCLLKANTIYTVQLFFHKDADYDLNMNIISAGTTPGEAYDVAKLPSAYKLGVVNSSANVKDYLACNSTIPSGSCASTANGIYVDTLITNLVNGVPVYQIDTFDLNTWFTFEVPDTGNINFRIIDNNNTPYVQCGYELRLFKGDASAGCSISLINHWRNNSSYYNICLDPGIYSVQFLGLKNTKINRNYCTYSNLGRLFDCTVSYQSYVKQKPASHYKPVLAENLGDITARLGNGFSTSLDYFGSPPDSFKIDKYKYYGNFVFRQFYISKPFYIKIEPSKGYVYNSYAMLLKGKATNGVDSLHYLEDIYGGINNYWDSSIVGLACKPLPPGWYTILSYRNNSCQDDRVYQDIYDLIAYNPCRQFDKPYKAGVFNNGQGLTFGPKYGTPQNPMYKNTYSGPRQCPVCADTPFIPFPVLCDYYYKPRRVSYYVFSLKKECALTIMATAYSDYGYLYKFNVLKDSSHLADSSYMIPTCANPYQYCRLVPGEYTLVYYSQYTDDYPPNIMVDSVGHSKYDFASNAYDFGLVPMNNTSLTSPREVVYCTTSAHYKDPIFDGKHLFEAGEYSVPLNTPIDFTTRYSAPVRDLWYTFMLAGSGTCNFDVIPFNNTTLRYYYGASIFKSNKGAISFTSLKSSGKIDSTLAQGLELVQVNSVSPYYNNWVFNKAGCDTARYYMLLQYSGSTNDYLNTSFTTDIHYKGITYDNSGDYCNNAKLISLSGAGTANGTVTVNCHSIGESFGEDGSNMACLLSDSLSKSKSSWFRFNISNTGKYDISFSLTNNTNVDGTTIRYRVLYGSCGAMTPGPCLGNAYSSFTLDCMSAGDYYIQVVMPAGAVGTIQLTAKALATKYPVCKPFNLLQPQANFSTIGGCNGEPITFVNLSTQGANIKYKWDFGDGGNSTSKSPVHKFTVSQAITIFNVKLSVMDTVDKLLDTLSLPVYVYRDPVIASAGNDTSVACGSSFHLNASCNYPGATFYWTPTAEVDNPYSATPLISPYKNITYKVTVHAENCYLIDSIKVSIKSAVKINGRPFICGGVSTTLSGTPGFDQYYWSTGERTQSIKVSTAGVYWLRAYNNSGFCNNADTIKILDISHTPLNTIRDTTVCYGDSFTLYSSFHDATVHYTWSNGDTSESIRAFNLGTYWVNASDGKCKATDTIVVKQKKYSVRLNTRDTSICSNDNFLLKAITNANSVRWSTGETSISISITKSGKYIVTAGAGSCAVTDTAHIIVNQSPIRPFLGLDTIVCKAVSITLDAGVNTKHYIWNTGDTTRKIIIKDTGLYIVTVSNDNICKEKASRRINLTNAFLTLTTDTFFCYGAPMVLSPKTNITALIWNTGDKSSSIFIAKPGKYWVQGAKDGCVLSDTANVRLSYPPIVHLGRDTLICDSFDMVLDAGPGDSYQWYPGGETSRRIYIRKHGPYTVIVKNKDGCTGSDTLRILEDCDPTIFVPNAFHAMDGDPNEIFKAYGTYISYFDMKIYNRWGERLFETENINQGWDGRYKGEMSEDGVYLYVIEYKGRYTHKQLTGTFHLLK